MINIISSPTTDHIPVTDCLTWQLQPDTADVFTTPGSAATVVVTFPSSLSSPASSSFKIWGYDFQALGSAATNWSATHFVTAAIGGKAAEYFANMLASNLFFYKNTTITRAGLVVTITWKTCGEQINFGAGAMVFTSLNSVGITATATNGTSAELVDGYKLVCSLLAQNDSGVFVPITEDQAVSVPTTCDAANIIEVNYMDVARRHVWTELPELTATSFIPTGNNTARKFALRYGYVYRDACQPVSGDFYNSDDVIVLNAAYPVEDLAGVRRYLLESIDGLPAGQPLPYFLTTQPKNIQIGTDSFAWLWLICNNSTAGFNKIRVTFAVQPKTGALSVHHYEFTAPTKIWQVVNFNVSPAFLEDEFAINPETIKYYDVTASAWAGTSIIGPCAESLRYIIANSCENTTDVYFLTPAGGHGTVLVSYEGIDIGQDATEIMQDVECGVTGIEKAMYKGMTPTNITNTETLTLAAVQPDTGEMRTYFAHLKASPQRWIKVPSTDGGYVAKKLYIETGGIRIFSANGQLILTISGKYDIPVQAGTEPISTYA